MIHSLRHHPAGPSTPSRKTIPTLRRHRASLFTRTPTGIRFRRLRTPPFLHRIHHTPTARHRRRSTLPRRPHLPWPSLMIHTSLRSWTIRIGEQRVEQFRGATPSCLLATLMRNDTLWKTVCSCRNSYLYACLHGRAGLARVFACKVSLSRFALWLLFTFVPARARLRGRTPRLPPAFTRTCAVSPMSCWCALFVFVTWCALCKI